MPNEAPDKPWAHIMVDFIVKLPLSRGYDFILVVCDQLTKMAHFIPTTEKRQQRDWQYYSRIMFGNCMDSLRVLSLTEEHSSWWG